jgi:penicillin-binding protein-related factor A (putative recombinase)
MSVFSIDRSNAKNTGKAFERELELTVGAYQTRRIATLRKVDPPSRVVGGGFTRKVIFLPNPFLDFVGVWTAQGGRAVFVEAKSTSVPRLAFNGDGGLTGAQWASMRTWTLSGAVAGLVWKYADRAVVFTPAMLEDAVARSAKSIRFESGRPIARGDGLLIWDFLSVLEA